MVLIKICKPVIGAKNLIIFVYLLIVHGVKYFPFY